MDQDVVGGPGARMPTVGDGKAAPACIEGTRRTQALLADKGHGTTCWSLASVRRRCPEDSGCRSSLQMMSGPYFAASASSAKARTAGPMSARASASAMFACTQPALSPQS
jgi:hypothetical protein